MRIPPIAIGLLIGTSATVCAAESAQIRIEISAAGQFSVAGKMVDDIALARALKEFASTAGEKRVLIVASKNAPLEAVAKVMTLCRESGLNGFSLQSK
jgi:biopolymer transport protein ExbD